MYIRSLTDAISFYCFVQETAIFGATLQFDPHFSTKWDNSNHFGGVSIEHI